MLTLSEVKSWLRLEQDDTVEDVLLQSLITAAEEYIRNAIPSWVDPATNPLVRLLALVLIADWHENREATGQVRPEMRPAVRAIVTQLQSAYPPPPDVPVYLAPGSGDPTAPEQIATLSPTFTWVYSHPEDAAQSAFQVLIFRVSDGVQVHDSGEVASSVSSYAVPAGVLVAATQYYWRVRVKDAKSGLFSAYSADAHILTAEGAI